MNALTKSFTQAVAEAKYLYATYVAPMPPAKVRAIMEQQGWKFGYEEKKPQSCEPSPFMNAAFDKYAKLVITDRTGKDIFDSGSAAIERYEEALKKAARQAYLKI